MLQLVPRGLPAATQQLDLFEQFAKTTPAQYTHTLELFDAIPKFTFGALTNLRRKASLEVVKRDFLWNGQRLRVTIEPTVLSAKDPRDRSKEITKQILPGSREEQVYRVLRKMASDPYAERQVREGRNPSVALVFTLGHLRTKLAEVGHEYRVNEIKEALQVLSRTPIKLQNLDTNKELYSSNSYIEVEYTGEIGDTTGSVTTISVHFNKLAARAILEGMTDWVHYERLMSLHDPLGEWIYESLTRNFRQAGVEYGYTLTLSRILAESPMRAYPQLRDNVKRVRKALRKLVEREVLQAFPPYKENRKFAQQTAGRGRRQLVDVEWVIMPGAEVVADIKADNARKKTRLLRLGT